MRVISLAFMIGLAGCTTITAPQPPAQVSTDRLSPVTLSAGECGLFVWTADADKRFILFSQASKKAGLWYDGASEHVLSIGSVGGLKASDQSPLMQLEGQNGLSLDLKLGGAQKITDGTRFKTGLLKYKSAEDWEKVTPVVGLATCQSE